MNILKEAPDARPEDSRKALKRRWLRGSDRYRREVALLVGAASGRGRDVRRALQKWSRERRLNVMRMAAFYAAGDSIVAAGMDPESGVGGYVNRMVRGDEHRIINSVRPLVRMARRLS